MRIILYADRTIPHQIARKNLVTGEEVETITFQEAVRTVSKGGSIKRASWRFAEVIPCWYDSMSCGTFPPDSFHSIFGDRWTPCLEDLCAEDWIVNETMPSESEPKPKRPMPSGPKPARWEYKPLRIAILLVSLLSLILSTLSLLLK